jgi:phage-related protein
MTIIPVLLQAAGGIVQTLFNYLMENLPLMMSAGMSLLQSVTSGISSNLPTLLQTAISMLVQFLATIAGYLPDLLVMGGELLLSIISGLISSIPDLLSGIGEILESAWDAFVNYDWLSLGKAIIDGIVQGLVNFGSSIGEKLKEIAGNAFKGIKKFFGIESPSKLMRDQIGRYIPEGIAVGIEANADSVTDAMNELSNMTVDAYDPNIQSVDVSGGGTSIIDEIKSLKEAILGMQLVLDTGATVGGLAPAMDRQLGSFAVYNGRGN